MILRHFRIMLQVKAKRAAKGEPLRPGDAPSLGLSPFVMEKAQRQGADWDWRSLSRAVKRIEEAYRTLVTSPVSDRLVLENLLFALANPLENFNGRNRN